MAGRDFTPDPRLFPFESHFFDSSVGPVHYLDEGEGPPILLLHGNPTWSFLYRGIVIRLRKRLRCVAPDYPGFGLSDHPLDYAHTPAEHAAVVGELVDHLGLEGMLVMGQDWGGPVGMRVALDRPDRIRGLVMGNTWYWPAEALHMKAFSAFMSSGFMQRLILKRNFFVERIMPLGTKVHLEEEVLDHYRGPLPDPESRAGVAELPRQITRASSWLGEIAAEVPGILGHKPLLLTWGVDDFAFTPAFMDRFRGDFRATRVLRLDARHYIQEDAPAEISRAILEFVDEPP